MPRHWRRGGRSRGRARAGAGWPRGRRRRGGRRDREGGGFAQQRSHPRRHYYATGLAKTRLCVEGKVMLYRFCREYGVQHRRSGKLIVAAYESEIAKLAALEAQAKANGVDDLLWLSGAGVRALEPALRGNRALLSPSTGIVDSHALMLALRPIFSSRRNASTASAGSSIVRDRV